MPQIRTCPICKKVLQVNEIHKCVQRDFEFVTCDKCGQKYKALHGHVCPTMSRS